MIPLVRCFPEMEPSEYTVSSLLVACLLSGSAWCSWQATLSLWTLRPRLSRLSVESSTTSLSLCSSQPTCTRWAKGSLGARGAWIASKSCRTLWTLYQCTRAGNGRHKLLYFLLLQLRKSSLHSLQQHRSLIVTHAIIAWHLVPFC